MKKYLNISLVYAIAAMAGIGHILTGTGIILLILSLKKLAEK